MVEKAKLDLLENLSDIEITDIMIHQTDEQEESPLPVSGRKWALNKLVLIVAPVVIVVLLIAVTSLVYLIRNHKTVTRPHSGTMAGNKAGARVMVSDKNSSEGPGAVGTPAVVEQVKENNVHFKDFIIDLKDKTGRSRILMCDVVFDINKAGNTAELENREDIRSLIYQTLAGRNAIVLRSLEERKRLKKELLQEAGNILGEGIVKNVYFTNYVIM